MGLPITIKKEALGEAYVRAVITMAVITMILVLMA